MINHVKKNKFLYSMILKASNRLPKKIYYPRSYFYIHELLIRQDRGELIKDELNEKLSSILREALINVPYYRELGLGIDPSKINKNTVLEYLELFPIISKNIVMEDPKRFLNQKFLNKRLITRSSSGSTGRGIIIKNSLEEILIEKAFYDYEWSKLGYRATSKVARIGADAVKAESEHPFSYSGDRLLISPNHINKNWFVEIHGKLKKFGTQFIHAYPPALYSLLQYMKENKLALPSLKGIFLASEFVDERILQLIKELFGDNVGINFSYGLTERTNLAWGIFHGNRIRYKCEEVYGFSENYLRTDGHHEIVGTSYWNYVMPLIRYRSEDLGEIIDGTIKELEGRAQDLLIGRNGLGIPSVTFEPEKFVWNYILAFQIVQNEIGKVEFHIVKKGNYTNMTEKSILESLNKEWNDYFDIEIKYIKKAQQTKTGKTKMVINNIN